VEWLIENQRGDGTWDEALSTGTGFPKVFYLSYHLYRNSFPLLALSGFLKAKTQPTDGARGGLARSA
jgi:squalene-hopene/tetraprenyl-beta-curcumene cyclase